MRLCRLGWHSFSSQQQDQPKCFLFAPASLDFATSVCFNSFRSAPYTHALPSQVLFWLLTFMLVFFNNFTAHICRIQDYWEGYKLFCYAYYSHSFQHEHEFRVSKLGWFLLPVIRLECLLLWALQCFPV